MSAAISARIIHASLVTGVLVFWGIAYFITSRIALPTSALPNRRVLYVGLFLVTAVLFGAAAFSALRLTRPVTGTSQDDWWRANLGRAVMIWSLIEAPTLLGTVAYLLTHDFRALIATLAGLLLFAKYRPSRLFEH